MNGYDLQKRNFLKNIAVAGAAGSIVAMSQLSAAAEGSDCPSKNSVFNVRDFGAKGDGKTSDTAAIQSASPNGDTGAWREPSCNWNPKMPTALSI